jgi:hypothetical protein
MFGCSLQSPLLIEAEALDSAVGRIAPVSYQVQLWIEANDPRVDTTIYFAAIKLPQQLTTRASGEVLMQRRRRHRHHPRSESTKTLKGGST